VFGISGNSVAVVDGEEVLVDDVKKEIGVVGEKPPTDT
jgi:hypothetical protein